MAAGSGAAWGAGVVAILCLAWMVGHDLVTDWLKSRRVRVNIELRVLENEPHFVVRIANKSNDDLTVTGWGFTARTRHRSFALKPSGTGPESTELPVALEAGGPEVILAARRDDIADEIRNGAPIEGSVTLKGWILLSNSGRRKRSRGKAVLP